MNTLNSLFEWMFLAGLRASLLVLAVLAAQWLLKNRLPSRWRYALWLPVLVALLVPALPLLPSWMSWPTVQVDVSEQAASPAPEEASQEFALPPLGLRADGSALPPNSIAASAAAPTGEPEPVNWRGWLMASWLIGAGGVSLFVVVSFALTMRRIRRASLPVKAESLAHIAETAQVVGLRRVPRVLQSSAVASPAVCGLWRPTLLLNERFPQDLSAEEAEMVLRHELTHIRRGDLALNALLCALLALHWWNPLLWLAFFRVRVDREAACDAQVLEGSSAARRAAYGHTLLKMETEFPPTSLCLGFVGILQRGGTLRERIEAIISQPQLNQTMKTTITLSIAVLTIAGIVKATGQSPASKPDAVAGENTPQPDGDKTTQQDEPAPQAGVWAQAEAKIEAHLRGIDPKMRYEEVKSERLSKYLPEFRVFRGLERNTIGQSSLFVVNKNGEIKDFDNDDRQAIAGFMRARKIQVKNQEDAIALVQFFEEMQGDTGYHNKAWKFSGEKKEGGWKVKITYVGDPEASIIMPPEYEMDIEEQGNFLDLRAIRGSVYIPTEE